jgi:hypothetical protein
MTRHLPLVVLLVALALAPAAHAQSATSSAKSARASSVRSSKAKTPASKTAASKSAASTTPAPPAGNRTLDEIHIEGEVAVPQVLFITARDQRRYLDFQHRRYLKSSRQLGESTVYPQFIQVTPTSANEARKETSR